MEGEFFPENEHTLRAEIRRLQGVIRHLLGLADDVGPAEVANALLEFVQRENTKPRPSTKIRTQGKRGG